MSRRYLLTVSDENGAHLERWLGGQLLLMPSPGVLADTDPAAVAVEDLDDIDAQRLILVARTDVLHFMSACVNGVPADPEVYARLRAATDRRDPSTREQQP